MKNPALVILAAGASTRMGEPKQLLPFKETTLLGTVIQNCKDTYPDNIYCVLGAQGSKIKSLHKEDNINFIQNDAYKNGLSSSIKKAVEVILEKKPTPSGILFLLGDQPYITKTYIQKYCKLHQENPHQVIATTYTKGNGVPALFPSNHLNSLLNLHGDTGAKQRIDSLTDKILLKLPIKTLTDIDTQEEYHTSLKRDSL